MRAITGAFEISGACAPDAARGGDPRLRAMIDLLAQQRPASAAEALRALRLGYPDIPLALRIAALRAGAR
ncbi:MAG TPA: hypothetical protein VLX44_03410 [Xanthobacteraceae bacterium]|nr:hypothetical protein [Xanthobacteraceae bacterium]